ncbi:MAG: acyl carrier protein [Acidobacteriota bacterium]
MTENRREVKGNSIKGELRKFITDRFLPFSQMASFEDADSFMEQGIIDSTGVLELLEFIEQKYQIKVEDEEVVPDNLDSLEKLTVYVGRKLGHARP